MSNHGTKPAANEQAANNDNMPRVFMIKPATEQQQPQQKGLQNGVGAISNKTNRLNAKPPTSGSFEAATNSSSSSKEITSNRTANLNNNNKMISSNSNRNNSPPTKMGNANNLRNSLQTVGTMQNLKREKPIDSASDTSLSASASAGSSNASKESSFVQVNDKLLHRGIQTETNLVQDGGGGGGGEVDGQLSSLNTSRNTSYDLLKSNKLKYVNSRRSRLSLSSLVVLSCWLKLVSVGFENLVSALNLAKRRLCRLAVQLSVLCCTVLCPCTTK